MHRNASVLLKLADTVLRGIFLVICTYKLQVIDAGRFGLVATLIAFSTFLMGYESFNDLQRRAAGRAAGLIRRCLTDKLRFYSVHNTWIVAMLLVLLPAVFGWAPWTVAIVVTIAVTELVALQSYYATVLDSRNYTLMLLANLRNLVLATGAIALLLAEPQRFTFDNVLLLWAMVSLVYLPLAAAAWLLGARQAIDYTDSVAAGLEHPVTQPIASHYRASFLHFLGGLVAIIALQADRFVVAGTLGSYDMGVYFRNVTLASLALQVFSIISFNRVSPRIFVLSRNGNLVQARALARKEYLRFFRLAVAAFAIAVLVNNLLGDPAARYDVSVPFLLVLACGVLLRSGADYAGVLLLAARQDRLVIRNQILSVSAGIILLIGLAIRFGLPGAIAGTLFAPLFCLLLHRKLLMRHP